MVRRDRSAFLSEHAWLSPAPVSAFLYLCGLVLDPGPLLDDWNLTEILCWASMWLTAVILVFQSLKQEDSHEFEVTLAYGMTACLRKTKAQLKKHKFFLRTTVPHALSSFISPLKSQARPDGF